MRGKHSTSNKRKDGKNSKSSRKRQRQSFSYWIESSGSSDSYNRFDIVKNSQITIEVTRVELYDDLLLSNPELKVGASCDSDACHGTPKFSISTGVSDIEEVTTEQEEGSEKSVIGTPAPAPVEKTLGDTNNIVTPSPEQRKKVQVVRSPSVLGKVKVKKSSFKNLPNGDCGDGVVNPHPEIEVLDKYWAQRRRLFSRFDYGIQLDSQGWYSTTPEVIADHTANRAVKLGSMHPSENQSGVVILDAFCGCGGNAIAFAKHKDISLVIAVDNDQKKIEMAKHNALVYGIPKGKIIFLNADAIEVINCYSNGSICSESDSISKDEKLPTHLDIIFLSPPWGGPEYLHKKTFDFVLNTRIQCSTDKEVTKSGFYLLQVAAKSARKQMVIIFLPRNTNGTKLGKIAPDIGYADGSLVEMEENIVNGKLKAITAYFGQNVAS